ncbi:hypothetical protein ACA910_020940 [Epithemia clementina (nom. ined.)]
MRNHMVKNATFMADQISDGTETHLFSLQDPLQLQHSFCTIGNHGKQIQSADLPVSNGILHVVDRILEPEFYAQSFNQLELQSEFNYNSLGRVSLRTIVDFVQGYDQYPHARDGTNACGVLHLGAQSHLPVLLAQYLELITLNRLPEIEFGKFLNASNCKETIRSLIQYSLPRKHYYLDRREATKNGS